MNADRSDVDAGVLEELLEALLEVAARKDALRAWPKHAPPDQDPPVQARRDDDGTLGVFRFFTIVEPGRATFDPVRQMTPEEAKARIDGIDGQQLRIGDEVGIELPLQRLCAIALADVEGARADRPHLLPPRIVEMLGNAPLADAVAARLASLRGPPPHVPLRALVTRFGGDAVEWTAVSHGDPGDLCLLVARGEEHRLVVVPTATSAAGQAAILRALAPPPGEQSLWRFLEVEGPALLCGNERSLWSDPGERRLSLEVNSIAIARDALIYGVARARARLLTWSGDRIIDEQEALVGLPCDVPRALGLPWPEGDALDRVLDAAADFRASLQKRLSALVDARAPKVEDVLAGAAFLRVLSKAAEGGEGGEGEPLKLREVQGGPDEICLRIGDPLVQDLVLVLSPADDVVKLRSGNRDFDLFVDGALVDGDPQGWRAFATVVAKHIEGSDLDVELAFSVEGGEEGEVETMMLSAWLAGLGERDALKLRWPPCPMAAERAAALHVLVDRFADRGCTLSGIVPGRAR